MKSARLLSAGVLASGALAGVLSERVIRHRVRPPGVDSLPVLHDTREGIVRTDDGVELATRESGPADAPLTFVFIHGYTCTYDCWAAQVDDLTDHPLAGAADGVRLVLYDHRGHGSSGVGPTEHNTIEQLGRDLAQVLRELVPNGRAVLIGHSMGGMTIMALAEQQPELFGTLVAAVALLGTSSGAMAEVSLGLPAMLATVPGRLLPYAPRAGANRRAEKLHAIDSDLARCVNRWVALGPAAPPGCHALMTRMQAPMTVQTMTSFLPTFTDHERTTALSPLKNVPTLVMVGEKDVLTPPSHSAVIADALPDAEHVVVPGSGHMVMMERPEIVNERLRALVERVLCTTG